jgi:hypothetical protein
MGLISQSDKKLMLYMVDYNAFLNLVKNKKRFAEYCKTEPDYLRAIIEFWLENPQIVNYCIRKRIK